MSKKENKIKGNIGEEFTCNYLEKNGYTILERNFTSYRGEIDIIALKNNEIIFIEVKTRTQIACGFPSESVTKHKQKQIYKIAEYYLYSKNLLNSKVRFDVIEIYLYGSNSFKINHIKDVISESPFNK